VDVTSEESVQKGIDACVKQFGTLNGVVQCAGIGGAQRVLSGKGVVHSLKAFERVVNINLVGTFNVLRLAVAVMAKLPAVDGERGVFVHTASVAAFDGQIGQAAYSASKSAVVGMTLPIARELGGLGIRVNTIAPGLFRTPMV
jgi:3-hydroxyacyl-CoA dehydrogenase/3-hydroxy-2-methylbutyryl-CoA dehydrogenase